MSFLGSIFGGIAHAVGTVFSVVSGVSSGIGGTIGEIINNVASIASNVISSIKGAVGTAFSAITGFTGNVISNIGGAINSVSQFIQAFITPVKNFVTEITDFVNRINTNFIEPIRNVVSGTYTAINNFAVALHTDLHNGIMGILSIPGDLANALTSVDANFQRATVSLGGIQQKIAAETIVPGLKETIGDQISAFTDAYNQTVGPKVGDIGRFHVESFYTTQDVNAMKQWATEVMIDNGKIGGAYGWFWKVLTDAGTIIPYINTVKSGQLEKVRQAAQMDEMPALLPLAEIVRSIYRGDAPFQQLVDEAARHGISSERLNLLIQNAAWLPGGRELAAMLFRGAVTQADADRVAAQIGYSSDDWKALQYAALDPPDPRQVITSTQRRAATENGWLKGSVGGATPPEVIAAARTASMNENRANAEWTDHWRIPSAEFWFTAWKRGAATEQDMAQAALAEGTPPEVVNMLPAVLTRTIELWMIPDMLGSGVIDEATATKYLEYIGMDAESAALIIAYGGGKAKAPVSAQAAELAKISASQAKKMYDAAIISQSDYVEILVAHGYSQQAADLTVALAVQENAITERTATAKGIVQEYKAGQITKEQGISQLYTLGYTTPEVDKYANEMKAAKAANAKMPTATELKDMLRYGVIDASQWEAGMITLGYSATWVPYLYALEVAQHGEPPKPS